LKIYTKKGDQGSTSLYRGGATSKASARIAAIGDVDELNCHIGLIVTLVNDNETTPLLQRIQNDLFDIGADLATIRKNDKDNKAAGSFKMGSEAILETQIDFMVDQLDPLTSFILPGGSASATTVHLARAVCRRAERTVVNLASNDQVSPSVIIYLNRLSDYLFTLARFQNKIEGVEEVKWQSSHID
jgi:cob(I)alamin adenosyltransferase